MVAFLHSGAGSHARDSAWQSGGVEVASAFLAVLYASFRQHRQMHGERRPLSHSTLHGDLPAVPLDHSIADVERYYADYNAVEVACGITDDLTKIATMTRLKFSVVKQYYRLVEKFQPHKMLKNQSSDLESSNPDAP